MNAVEKMVGKRRIRRDIDDKVVEELVKPLTGLPSIA